MFGSDCPGRSRLQRLKPHQTLIALAIPGETTAEEASALARQLLSEDERRSAARFIRSHDRHDFVVARALVRLGLSQVFPVEPSAWRFDRDEKRKPFIVAPSGLEPFQFSVSHTRGLVALLVSRAEHAGVDVESIRRTNDLPLVASRICAPIELESLNRLTSQLWRDRFFQLWTLKEAYAKARGLGLALRLDHVAFEIAADGKTARAQFSHDLADDAARWKFSLTQPTREHMMATAIADSGSEIVQEHVRIAFREERASLEETSPTLPV
jgi:4'-phosphopantetheinyl transferase